MNKPCLTHIVLMLLTLLVTTLYCSPAMASEPKTQGEHVARLMLKGPIGPATTDYVKTAIDKAFQAQANLIILEMDTPGGLDAATRDIIQAILDAPIPIATYVHPAGARAASAGTYILYASHIAAMTPSTTLGAATPVSMTGGGMPEPRDRGRETAEQPSAEDEPAKEVADNDSAMKKKVVNDSVAFIRALAERRDRNVEWAEQAVLEAATLTATEALEKNVIDYMAEDIRDLIAQLDGEAVTVMGRDQVLSVGDVAVVDYNPTWRQQLLAIITNPQIAYILLLIGIYGLIFEGYSPGAMVPGIVGVICLLLGLYAMQVLPINYVGLALIFVGAGLTAAELFIPSFGVLGIGGIVALAFGSIMLIDTDVPGLIISPQLIAAVIGVLGSLLLVLFFFVGKSLRMGSKASKHELVNQIGHVHSIKGEYLQIRIRGELWHAQSQFSVNVGDPVLVTEQNGLILTVKPN